MMSGEETLNMAKVAINTLAAQKENGTSTRSKAPATRPPRVPTTEIPVVAEVLGFRPDNVAISRDPKTGEKKVTFEGTEGSSREGKMYHAEVGAGARTVKRTQICFRGEDGKQYRKTLPNTDRDLGVALGDVFSSKLTAYAMIRDAMEDKGYHVAIDPKGSSVSSGHVIYQNAKPRPQPGINYPEDYRYLKPIPVSQLAVFSGVLADTINQQLDTVEQLMDLNAGVQILDPHTGRTLTNLREKQDLQMEMGGRSTGAGGEGYATKDKLKAYRQIMSVWGGFELFNKTGYDCGVTLAGDRQPYQRPINVDGSSTPGTRFVPQLDWFDARLQEIDNEQLLSLLPESEREVMMLFLGRAMMGRQGTPFTNGGVQDLKWRSLVVFEGPQAGMGRTTLLDYLGQGLKICGYNAEAIDDLTGRFGHGRTATADLGYIDDLDPQGTIRTISSALLKTVASGGTLKVEEKGLKSYEVTAMGVYMLCTNQLNLAELATLDSGNLSRLMPMRNACSNDRRAKEYLARYGVEINTDLTYEFLSNKYGVPIETLVMLLLARSAEKFKAIMEQGQRHLVTTLESLKKRFIINTDMDYIDEMFQHYARLAATVSDDGAAPKVFNIHQYLSALIKLNGSEAIPGCSDTPDLILEYARSSLGSKKRGSATVIKEFMSVLSSCFGLGYISDHGKLLQLYRQKVEQFDTSDIAQAIRRGVWEKDALTDDDRKLLALRDRLKMA